MHVCKATHRCWDGMEATQRCCNSRYKLWGCQLVGLQSRRMGSNISRDHEQVHAEATACRGGLGGGAQNTRHALKCHAPTPAASAWAETPLCVHWQRLPAAAQAGGGWTRWVILAVALHDRPPCTIQHRQQQVCGDHMRVNCNISPVAQSHAGARAA